MQGERCLAPLCTSLQEITTATLIPLLTPPPQLSRLPPLCLLHLSLSLLQTHTHFLLSLQCMLPPPPHSLLLQLKVPQSARHLLNLSPLQLHSHFPLLLLLLTHLPPLTFLLLPSPNHIPLISLRSILPLPSSLFHLHLSTLSST